MPSFAVFIAEVEGTYSTNLVAKIDQFIFCYPTMGREIVTPFINLKKRYLSGHNWSSN